MSRNKLTYSSTVSISFLVQRLVARDACITLQRCCGSCFSTQWVQQISGSVCDRDSPSYAMDVNRTNQGVAIGKGAESRKKRFHIEWKRTNEYDNWSTSINSKVESTLHS